MKVTDVHVDGTFFTLAIKGGRLSYRSEGRSDSYIQLDSLNGYHSLPVLGPVDKKWIADRFKARAVGETKFLRTIPISLFVSAPMKWWWEADAYKVGTVRQSDSLMHRGVGKGPFTRADFDVTDDFASSLVFERYLADLNTLWSNWKATGGRRNDRQSEAWQNLQDFVARSYVYNSQWWMNYEVLRAIYWQRKNHRMSSQWSAFFAQVFELGLPYPELITDEVPFLTAALPAG